MEMTFEKHGGVINALIGKSNDKSSISETLKINNKDTTDHKDIAEAFCDFFLQILVLNLQTKYHPQNLNMIIICAEGTNLLYLWYLLITIKSPK